MQTSFVLYGVDLNKLTILRWISGIVNFLVALVADQVSTLRREIAAFSMCETGGDEKHVKTTFSREPANKNPADCSSGGTG